MDIQELVREFHIKYGHPINKPELIKDEWLMDFRLRLVEEELEELADALFKDGSDREMAHVSRIEVAKELGDMLYVVYGLGESLGIPMDEVVREIHVSNMTKTANGMNKPTKGPKFKPAKLGAIVG